MSQALVVTKPDGRTCAMPSGRGGSGCDLGVDLGDAAGELVDLGDAGAGAGGETYLA